MTFNIALSGINAASSDLEVTANNIANVNTTGFKGSRAEFSQVYSSAGQNLSANSIGNGVRLTNVAQQFTDGNLNQTGNNLDFGIAGNGFFVMKNGAGYSYTRAGAFQQDDNGYIVNAMGQRLQAYPVTATGQFDMSTLTDLQLQTGQSPAKATTAIGVLSNLPGDATVPTVATFNKDDANSYNYATPYTAYDSLGATHSGMIYYVKDATANTWNAHMVIDGTEAGTPQQISFTTGGALVTPAGGKLNFGAVSPNPGANPLNISVDVTKMTQYGSTFSTSATTNDGYAAGKFSQFDVSTSGVVSAQYNNGQSKVIGQVAMVTFANNQGLRQLNNTDWAESSDSGQPIRGVGNSGDVGAVQSGQLEASNTADLTAQLVNMIKAQRNYQANAQVISTDDKLTQTIINIRN
ncbi:flagellar hook protein FlgE [Luteibacter sp. Sphag1AF]|uniref:flagellar hook protein FlgE n=1 Tax=Luteibacter sp. Sphag1AF TaxID=2587031 RepID=UPI00161EBFAF|nr:flagellar hook protein FlgE [Luteibacter sp. Sphag1AF]MBB3225612.1 flagellar hook protein FlgE [Luteibacter sp. Sphag1AF]